MTIEEALHKACQLIIARGVVNLKAQGHIASGDLINSLSEKVYSDVNSYIGEISGLHYGLAQDTGVRPSSFGKGGAGGIIQGLIEWLNNKSFAAGIVKKKGAAIAIYKNMLNVGIHSRNNRFAPQYQKWLTYAIEDTQGEVDRIIGDAMDLSMTKYFDNAIDETLRNFKGAK